MTARALTRAREQIQRAVHELHQAERDLREGRHVAAERLQAIHEELSALARKIR